MPVMQVRKMRVAVAQRRVAMPVAVHSFARLAFGMVVLVMVVMAVAVFMLECFVDVFVRVPLAEMQPYPPPHQGGGNQKRQRHRVAEQGYGQHGAQERRRRKIGAGARRAEVPQRQHEQDEADTIAKQPE